MRHFPPGTSKWNEIERHLFSHISLNWRDQPLVSHEVIAQVSDSEFAAIGITRDDRHRDGTASFHRVFKVQVIFL